MLFRSLMGPADPEEQRPMGPRVMVLATALPCAPCSHVFKAPYTCAIGSRACVAEADIAAVATRLIGLAEGSDQTEV